MLKLEIISVYNENGEGTNYDIDEHTSCNSETVKVCEILPNPLPVAS